MVSNPRQKLGPARYNRGRDSPAEYQASPMQELSGAARFRQMPVHLIYLRFDIAERRFNRRDAFRMIGRLVKSRRHGRAPAMES